MKLLCQQDLLNKAMNTVSKAVSIRTTLPILKGILLEADITGFLKITATDQEINIERIIPAKVEEEGKIVVSANVFSDIVKKLPKAEVNMELTENNLFSIKCLLSEFNIVAQGGEEFPETGDAAGDIEMDFDNAIFRDMIKKTAFAASTEEALGVIVGLLMEIKDGELNIVAVDSHRLAIRNETMKGKNDIRIIVHARILNEIGKILSEEESDNENFKLILDKKKIVVLLKNIKIVARQLEGEFINYKDLLPKENTTKITINKKEMADAIERASILTRDGKANLVRIGISDNNLLITSRSEEGNVKEEIAIVKEGEDLEIGMNSRYLYDALRTIEDEEITMEFGGSTRPCIIKPVKGEEYIYLILPVRLLAG